MNDVASPGRPMSPRDLRGLKERGERFVMVSATDFPSAAILEQAGIRVLAVGDSLGRIVLGHRSALELTPAQMAYHARAVVRGAPSALVIVDVPPASLAEGADGVARAARILMDEGTASAVKVDGGEELPALVEMLAGDGIPVVAGLQAIGPGDWNDATIARFIDGGRAAEAAGAFALVVVGIPPDVGEALSAAVRIPVIGGGAGRTDGQIAVWHWLFGLNVGGEPRFSRRYEDLRPLIDGALARLVADVEAGSFPGPEQEYPRTEAAPT